MQEAVKFGRVIVPVTEIVARPGGPNGSDKAQLVSKQSECEWHAVGLVYCRVRDGEMQVRLYYESHISQQAKNEIFERFGVIAIQWEMTCEE